jgi:bacillithiol system protein YtxJ
MNLNIKNDEAHWLAAELARRTGVRHESPQVLLLRGGRAAWSASHAAVTAEAVERALADGSAGR